ncbi:MAG: hypothetical protein IPK16_25790 [Anaerolineales bacterium]|nr:hypothetical protein [Anaerolineales bacterium]
MEFRRRWMGVWAAILIAGLLAPSAVYAQDTTPFVDPIIVTAESAGVAVHWQTSAAQPGSIDATGLPTVHFQGYDLPMKFLTFEATGADTANVQFTALDAVDLSQDIVPTGRSLPPALDFASDPETAAQEKTQLPNSPVFVAGEGRLRDRLLVKLAISPVYNDNGVVKIATRIEATISGVSQLPSDLQTLANTGEFRATLAETVSVPTNAAALRSAYKLVVDKPGIQEVYYQDLGLSSPPADMRLAFNGAEVAIERLVDRFRFYAPRVGDRWNLNSVYWLTLEPGVMRIGPRGAAPSAAAGVAYEHGRWTDNFIYDSTHPGADNDRWFGADLRVEPSSSQYPTVTVPVDTVLPLRNSPITIAADVTPFLTPAPNACLSGAAGYRLEASFLQEGIPSGSQIQAWNPAPSCILVQSSTITWTSPGLLDAVRLRLLPAPDYPTGVKLDSVTWQAPVRLNFGGVTVGSIDFWSAPGAWSYAWTNLPGAGADMVADPAATGTEAILPDAGSGASAAAWQLYDVTVEAQPQIVPASTSGFNQAAGSIARHYVFAQLNALSSPQVSVHQAINFAGVKAANAIYIGPARFAAATQPLLELRKQQGYAPLYVDVQQVYDVYGFGHVSNIALRNFLRHATDWQNTSRQISVVLVGDGNYDPHDYLGLHNENLVTPFMDDVDPFLREAACEPCYGQLNGDDAKTGDNRVDQHGVVTPWFVQDVWIGRFPVRSEQEVADVVAKIVKYETTGSALICGVAGMCCWPTTISAPWIIIRTTMQLWMRLGTLQRIRTGR